MPVETWDLIKAADAITDGVDRESTVLATLFRHAGLGKGIAVYCNEDLGHPEVGHHVGLTYGTPEAQFEPKEFPDGPPEQCPDGLMTKITGGINWRYRLVAVVPPKEPA